MHTQSGAAIFAACRQLFRCHPLAVTQPPAGSGRLATMVLRHRTAGFFVLTRPRDDLFVLRSWQDCGGADGVEQEIQHGKPVTDLVRQVIMGCLPVPRHGSLLGWVTSHQVTALLAVRSLPPSEYQVQAQDTLGSLRGSTVGEASTSTSRPAGSAGHPAGTAAGAAPGAVPVPRPARRVRCSAGPEVRVLPLEGTTKDWHWPSFTVSPLDDWRFWEHVEWGELVDVMPLLSASPGRAFWVPSLDGRPTGHVVLTDNIRIDQYWIPKGVYYDHWIQREGIEAPPAEDLVALPHAVDLAKSGLWPRRP